MKILVTGGAGFIGSNFVRHMLAEHTDVEILNFDAITYAGNLENLADVERDPRYRFVKGDVAAREEVGAAFDEFAPDVVVNFAAESHVDRSLHLGPEAFIRTNILGTQILIEAALAHNTPRFVQISTDEVYGSLGPEGRFSEKSPVQPNNPYAATKAGADFMVRAAHRSHGLNAVITRCSNNFGPYQFPEKLIPLMIANALEDKPLPVYGDGMQVRDWIYVLDHCRAVDLVMRKGAAGEVYNVGAMGEMPNIEIVRLVLRLLGKPESLIRFVKDRPGHDRRYAIDATKLRADLGWAPQFTFEQAMRSTVEWYLANRSWWERIRSGEYQAYYQRMYANR